ncbi:beta-glucoside-specific PTS transporter subunit IIABC [Paenibacillus sp. LK1]|uniref:beta-glucoside-specific PTS transporter subunit IIABC n=1 Tax=Paenibacillus sp. LK1 TaxID=2053014 RepID=UPI000C18A2DA|nr:beta-glucoside-specific PTS transporter subunit IIABC [Paenibacillus sp. LK1]PIH60277.1 PTS beta-glucoside transporter subunit IIABC [Paenibacillus sp. LK1]
MNQLELGKEIIKNIGGEENIKDFYHCATRLRFILVDTNKADKKKIENLEGVISVVISGGQFQVIIGNKVKDVYTVITQNILNNFGQSEEKVADNRSPVSKLIDLISGIFSPAFGLLAGTGLLKGILLLATLAGLSQESGAYIILNAASDSLFYFLPIVLAISAARKFKTDQFLSVVIAGALVYPTIVSAFNEGKNLDFFGIPVVLAQYSSSVIPIILAVWILSKVEPVVKKFLHETIQTFITPMICLVIMVPLTLIVVGPISTLVGDILAQGYLWIYELSPIVSGIIIGALWQVFVIFGLHWAFIPIMINNLSNMGYDTLMAMCTPAVVAQAGAALGVFLRSKDKKFRSLSFSAFVSGLFGVTEPAIYGVTLKLKKPFIMGVISGAVGGAIIGLAGSRSTIFGTLSFITFPAYFGKGFAAFAFSYFLSLILACVLTYFFGGVKKYDQDNQVHNSNAESELKLEPVNVGIEKVMAPSMGELIRLEDISDESFASGALGKGFGVKSDDGLVVSPVEGEISTIVKSQHALVITSTCGSEILIHVGINTVSLKGQGFNVMVKEGQKVHVGDSLISFDKDFITEKGLDPTVILIITNSYDYQNITVKHDRKKVNPTDEIILLDK